MRRPELEGYDDNEDSLFRWIRMEKKVVLQDGKELPRTFYISRARQLLDELEIKC